MRSSLTQRNRTDAVNSRRLEDSILNLARELDKKHPVIEVAASGTTSVSRLASQLAGHGRNYVLLPTTKAGLVAGLRGIAETVTDEELEVTLYANSSLSGVYSLMAVEV